MLPRIGVLVLSVAFQLWLAQASPLSAQARTGPSNKLPCTSPQAQDLLKELETKAELDSVLELFRARQINYSIDNLTKPFFPDSDLERLGQEGTRYRLYISVARSGSIFISADVVSLEFEGPRLIMRSCRKVLTGP